jgi:3-hydroxyacyl-[acyl-carrier-protein] dehydratase
MYCNAALSCGAGFTLGLSNNSSRGCPAPACRASLLLQLQLAMLEACRTRVDRVLALDPHKSIKALKNVSINEPYFASHFQKRPVMPGVLILEALAQTAALLTFPDAPHDPASAPYLFVGIDNARFRRVVEPDDQLILNATFERHIRGIGKFKARAEVDGVVAAEAGLICTVRHTDGDGQ